MSIPVPPGEPMFQVLIKKNFCSCYLGMVSKNEYEILVDFSTLGEGCDGLIFQIENNIGLKHLESSTIF